MTRIPPARPGDGTALSPTARTWADRLQLQHTHAQDRAFSFSRPPAVIRPARWDRSALVRNQSDNMIRCSPPASASPSMQGWPGWLAGPPVPLSLPLPPSRPALTHTHTHARQRSRSQIGCQGCWGLRPLRCGRSSDQGPRGAGVDPCSTPHPCLHLKYPCCFPRHWPKRRPLAQQSLRLTPADLAGRANLDWLPPLGPHADMHERFAVTLGRPVSGQSAPPDPMARPQAATTPTTRSHFPVLIACLLARLASPPLPLLPRACSHGSQDSLPGSAAGGHATSRPRFCAPQRAIPPPALRTLCVPTVTPGHRPILRLRRHSSRDTCHPPQKPRDKEGHSLSSSHSHPHRGTTGPPLAPPSGQPQQPEAVGHLRLGLRGGQSQLGHCRDTGDLRAAQICTNSLQQNQQPISDGACSQALPLTPSSHARGNKRRRAEAKTKGPHILAPTDLRCCCRFLNDEGQARGDATTALPYRMAQHGDKRGGACSGSVPYRCADTVQLAQCKAGRRLGQCGGAMDGMGWYIHAVSRCPMDQACGGCSWVSGGGSEECHWLAGTATSKSSVRPGLVRSRRVLCRCPLFSPNVHGRAG